MTEPAPHSPSRQGNPPTALVLDRDGTLLDTVYLHVLAWWEGFSDAGYEVSSFDIHRAIGLGSQDLVETLVGTADPAVVDAHAERWAPLREKCLPFHGVPELIRACADRGMRVVYCTSGAPEDVEDFRQKIGCDDVISGVVNSGDVEQGKPAPDIVRAALEAVGAAPRDAVMLGDTVYDVRAASAAGVACIGLLCGGIGERELQEAGAAAVYGSPSDLPQDPGGLARRAAATRSAQLGRHTRHESDASAATRRRVAADASLLRRRRRHVLSGGGLPAALRPSC